MTSQLSLAVTCLVLALTAHAQAYDSALYEDMLFQDLYKRLTQMDNYYPMDEQSYGGQRLYDQMIPLDSRDSGQADIRDPEFLAHSSNSDGFQYISGGAGEGKQHLTPEGTQENTQEVKSDDVLPFYCHPPNPCPKGYTEEDGCQMNVADTAEEQKEWISAMQSKGMCTCDEEHMFDCPSQQMDGDMEGLGGLGGQQPADNEELDSFIYSMLGDKAQEKYDNPYVGGNRIDARVAKKSPRVKRSIKNIDEQLENLRVSKKSANPYLQGTKLHIVAKKGFRGNL